MEWLEGDWPDEGRGKTPPWQDPYGHGYKVRRTRETWPRITHAIGPEARQISLKIITHTHMRLMDVARPVKQRV